MYNFVLLQKAICLNSCLRPFSVSKEGEAGLAHAAVANLALCVAAHGGKLWG